MLHPLLGSRVGYQLLHEAEIGIVEVAHGIEGDFRGGLNERDALTGGAKVLEAAVLTAAKRAGERVVVDKSFREGRRDDGEGVAGGNVGAEVAEGEVEIGVIVEVR